MALLTALSLDEARPLFAEYGIDLRRLVPLAAGSVNSNFFAEGADGQEYFARIYEEQGESGAQFELLLNERLQEAGVPVARPVRKLNGELVSLVAGKPFAVYEKCTGQVLEPEELSPQVLESLGAALAQVHSASYGDLDLPEGRFGYEGLRARLVRVEESGRADLYPAVNELRALLSQLAQRRCSTLPLGLIHGDLFRDNVLVQGGAIAALIDFESACRGPYVYDLAVTLLAWCFSAKGFEWPLCRALLQGYHQVRPLSALEKENFLVEAEMACVRFAITRLTDFSLRVPAGVAPERDFRRFLERRAALQKGELQALVEQLSV